MRNQEVMGLAKILKMPIGIAAGYYDIQFPRFPVRRSKQQAAMLIGAAA